MIEHTALVVRTEGELAWVRAESPSSCGACGGKGCGSSLWVRMLHPREPEYQVANPIAAVTGESVVVGIEDGALLRAAVAGYLVPLLLMLLGAVAGSAWGEPVALAGALAGLLVAAFWLKRRRALPAPVILRRGEVACHSH